MSRCQSKCQSKCDCGCEDSKNFYKITAKVAKICKLFTKNLKANHAEIKCLNVTDKLIQPVDPIVGVYNFSQNPVLSFTPPPGLLTGYGTSQFNADGSVILMNTYLLGVLFPSPPLPVSPPAISASHLMGRWTKTGPDQYLIRSALVCVKNTPELISPTNFSRGKMEFTLTLTPTGYTASGFQAEYSLTDYTFAGPVLGQAVSFKYVGYKVF